MIAVDTNLLVYAFFHECPEHVRAIAALRELEAAEERWAIPWPCIHEFLSTATNPRLYSQPDSPLAAVNAVEGWLLSEKLSLLSEGPGYLDVLRKFLLNSRVRGGQIHDARIAAICLHHGVRELWTCDRDFSRFPQLKVRNPLVGR